MSTNNLEVYEFADPEAWRKLTSFDAEHATRLDGPVLNLNAESSETEKRAAETEIEDALASIQIRPEYIYCLDKATQKFEIYIDIGDWYHDHEAADQLLWEKFHLTCISVRQIGESDTDSYGAVHEYVQQSLCDQQKPIKESTYSFIDSDYNDELNAINYGGYDEFDNSDLLDDPKIERRAEVIAYYKSQFGWSDLRIANMLEKLGDRDIPDEVEEYLAGNLHNEFIEDLIEKPIAELYDSYKADAEAGDLRDEDGYPCNDTSDEMIMYIMKASMSTFISDAFLNLMSITRFLKIFGKVKDIDPEVTKVYEGVLNKAKEFNEFSEGLMTSVRIEIPEVLTETGNRRLKARNKRNSKNKAKRSKLAEESYDVSTVEGLAKYSKDLAAAVLDGKVSNTNAVIAICSMLHCNTDYAVGCLDAWIETEQINRSRPRMTEDIISRGRFGIEVRGATGWDLANNEYPKPGDIVEFPSEAKAKASELWKRLVDRYGEKNVRVHKSTEK